MNILNEVGAAAKKAAAELAQASSDKKNAALRNLATKLKENREKIIAANILDVNAAREAGLANSFIDRLSLSAERIDVMMDALETIINLPDPVGIKLDELMRPNGLRIARYSVPLGVIGIIFESRPNVAIDAAALCIKSGNACILRGGHDSWNTVSYLIALIGDALEQAGLPKQSVQTVPDADRKWVGALLSLSDYVDVIIPRGGKSLTARVREESKIPVFSHLDGICHTYIDAKADAEKAEAIAMNAKMRRTSICGATECLVLHKDIANSTGKKILYNLAANGCEVRVPHDLLEDKEQFKIVNPEQDYGTEFLAPIIAVKIVANVQDAVVFINQHNSQHTDAIITEDDKAADYFLRNINSAIAIQNASTQFADGGEFGKGAEIGISTGKLHARGPVALRELTTYQYRVYGDGQTRP